MATVDCIQPPAPPAVSLVAQKVRGLVRRRLVPKWLQRLIWDAEYASGMWDFTWDTLDDPIYPLLRKYSEGGSVLDVGCGIGTTLIEMPATYKSYLGIDISNEALRTARERAFETCRPNFRFLESGMHNFTTREKFDVILFREILTHVPRWDYLRDRQVLGFLQHYAAMLSPNGVMISRLCDDTEKDRRVNSHIKSVVRRHFHLVEGRYTDHPAAQFLVFR